MKYIKAFWKKLWFEIRMQIMDARWRVFKHSCFEMYPPSFYYRYSTEEQAKIRERDFKNIQEMLVELEAQK